MQGPLYSLSAETTLPNQSKNMPQLLWMHLPSSLLPMANSLMWQFLGVINSHQNNLKRVAASFKKILIPLVFLWMEKTMVAKAIKWPSSLLDLRFLHKPVPASSSVDQAKLETFSAKLKLHFVYKSPKEYYKSLTIINDHSVFKGGSSGVLQSLHFVMWSFMQKKSYVHARKFELQLYVFKRTHNCRKIQVTL